MVLDLSLKINQEHQHTSTVYILLMLECLQHRRHSEGQHIVLSLILLKMMRDNLCKYVI